METTEIINRTLMIAAEKIYDDYSNDKELTAFINIDFDDFYESKSFHSLDDKVNPNNDNHFNKISSEIIDL